MFSSFNWNLPNSVTPKDLVYLVQYRQKHPITQLVRTVLKQRWIVKTDRQRKITIPHCQIWKICEVLVLDPNTYSLGPFHSSLRNIVVRFCVKYLRLNLAIFSVVSISHFRLEQIWKFRFVSFSSAYFVIFFASSSQFSHQLLTNVSIVFVEFPFTISSFY